jgi:hypothetical protein
MNGQRVYDGFVKVDKVAHLGRNVEVVRCSNSVAFLVKNTTTNQFMLALQNRAPMINEANESGEILEAAAGRFDIKIGVKGLIIKELLEELGVIANEDEIHLFNNGVPLALSPGVLTEVQYLAYVEIDDSRVDKTKKIFGVHEEGERIIRMFITEDELKKLTFHDMKTFALYHAYCNLIKG